MRIFVGTLHTIENEYEDCVASIQRQAYRDFEHFVFSNLPNKEAHDKLYRSFMDRASEFDLMIKVDADMVISDEYLFAKIVKMFQDNAQLEDLEIAVHDFFSDQLVWGMHAYRNTVKWRTTDEDLFVDQCFIDEERRIHDDAELAPAAIHCPNPSPFQAFHYGVHKALKTVQPGRTEPDWGYARSHWGNIRRTWDHFLRTKDARLGYAVLGAEVALRGGVWPQHLDFSNPYLHHRFQRYEGLSAERLLWIVRALSFMNFGFLGDSWRFKFLMKTFRVKAEWN